MAGLGFVADLLSKPTMIGYMNGLAVTILVGQLPKLFGFSVDADGLIGEFSASSAGVARRRGRPRRGRGRRAAGIVLILRAAALVAEGAGACWSWWSWPSS